jgi:hypothetical protein
MKIPLENNLISKWLSHMTLNPVRNFFPLCADVCGESNDIVSTEKVPGICSDIDAVVRAGSDMLEA